MAVTTPPSEAKPASSVPELGRRRMPRMQEFGLIIVIFILYAFFAIASNHFHVRGVWNPFLSMDNQVNGISRKLSVYAIMAVGMTCVVITGGIDISVGAILALAELSGGYVLMKMSPDSSLLTVMVVAFAVPVVVGGLCGMVNGGIKTLFRMHPFVVTLATLSIIRGICVLYFPPNVPVQGHPLPSSFLKLMRYDFNCDLELVPLIIMLVVVILGILYLQTTIAGRETYAVGGNEEAARFSGIRVWWAGMRVYIIMGACCGVAAVVELGRFGSTATNAGDGYELTVIASAVVGGASLTGGRGTSLGALLGTLVIASLENGILTMQWDTNYTKIIVGSSIIIAVSVDRLSAYYLRSRKGRSTAH